MSNSFHSSVCRHVCSHVCVSVLLILFIYRSVPALRNCTCHFTCLLIVSLLSLGQTPVHFPMLVLSVHGLDLSLDGTLLITGSVPHPTEPHTAHFGYPKSPSHLSLPSPCFHRRCSGNLTWISLAPWTPMNCAWPWNLQVRYWASTSLSTTAWPMSVCCMFIIQMDTRVKAPILWFLFIYLFSPVRCELAIFDKLLIYYSSFH